MEGAHGDAGRAFRAEQGGEAVAQFVAGAAGEGDGQAALRCEAGRDPVRDRVREHPGLARARTRHHKQRPAVVRDDRLLVRVESGWTAAR